MREKIIRYEPQRAGASCPSRTPSISLGSSSRLARPAPSVPPSPPRAPTRGGRQPFPTITSILHLPRSLITELCPFVVFSVARPPRSDASQQPTTSYYSKVALLSPFLLFPPASSLSLSLSRSRRAPFPSPSPSRSPRDKAGRRRFYGLARAHVYIRGSSIAERSRARRVCFKRRYRGPSAYRLQIRSSIDVRITLPEAGETLRASRFEFRARETSKEQRDGRMCARAVIFANGFERTMMFTDND